MNTLNNDKNIYHVGIDLHGTLLNHEEKLAPGSEELIVDLLKNKPDNIKVYICTGNDLLFIKRKLGKIFDFFDGAILETGCVISGDREEETVLVKKDIIDRIKLLELELKSKAYPQVYKFARRLTSISLFTNFGESVSGFFEVIHNELKDLDFCRVTYSSVAVDIIPSGFDKYSGLKFFAGNDGICVGIADAMNDIEMLKKADLVYLPGNSDAKVIDILLETRKKQNFEQKFQKGDFFVSKQETTFGVIESLKHLIKFAQ